MTKAQTFYVMGHKMAVLPLNQDVPGEPIILLHGVSHSVGGWSSDTVFRNLGPCYAISLPGHFPAGFPPGFTASQLTTELIGELVSRAITHVIGDRPATIAGFSTGGYAALVLGALYPKLATRLICIAGFAQGRWGGPVGAWQQRVRSGRLGRLGFELEMQVTKRIPLDMFLRASIWDHSVGDPQTLRVNRDGHRAFAKGLHDYFPGFSPRALAIYCQAMYDIDITELLPTIQAPTLVLFGSKDPIVPPEQGRLIARLVPKSTLAELAGAGHLVMVERPVEYDQIIASWLKESRKDIVR